MSILSYFVALVCIVLMIRLNYIHATVMVCYKYMYIRHLLLE